MIPAGTGSRGGGPGGGFFSCRDKGNRDPGGGRDPRPRKRFPGGCEFSPSSWHCPSETPWELSSAAPAPPAPDSDPPQTQAGPSAQCPVGPGWLTGCHAGKLAPRGVRAGLMTSCRGRQEKLAVPLDGQSALHGEMLHRGAGVSAGPQLSHLPPFRRRETGVEYGTLNGLWDPKPPR